MTMLKSTAASRKRRQMRWRKAKSLNAPMDLRRTIPGITSCLVGSKIYIIGRLQTQIIQGQTLLSWYDTHTKIWGTSVLDGPCTFDHSAVLYRDKVFLFGGRQLRVNATNLLHCLDIPLHTLESCSPGGEEWPQPRALHTANVTENRGLMVVFGGQDKHACSMNDIAVLDMNLLKWKKQRLKGVKPMARFAHSSCSVATDIYYFGGLAADNTELGDLHILSTGSSQWSWSNVSVEEEPCSRRGATLSLFKGNLLLFGGRTGQRTLTNDLCLFSVQQRKWLSKDQPPRSSGTHWHKSLSSRGPATAYHCSIASMNGLFILGGEGRDFGDVAVLSDRSR